MSVVQPMLANIENAGNTCYMDSLIIALFYVKSCIENHVMSNREVKNPLGIYIQEFIKNQIIDPLRNGKSVTRETMDTFRSLCFQSGWRNSDEEEYFRQQDVSEFYSFIAHMLDIPMIEMQKRTITEAIPDKDDTGKKEQMAFVPLSLPNDKTDVKIATLLYDWMHNNYVQIKRKINTGQELTPTNVNSLQSYSITNFPMIVPLSINRFRSNNERLDVNIIIQKKINPVDGNFQHEWKLLSVICHNGLSSDAGHYYTLFTSLNKWYISDDLKEPSIYEVAMNDKNITSRIKRECVFLIYIIE